jgi:nuclease HARBI1
MSSCIGYIDGVMFETCRPSWGQEALWSGKDKHHGIRFHGICLPNGLLLCTEGPYNGKDTDLVMLNEGAVVGKMDAVPAIRDKPFYLYGDQIYTCSRYVIIAFDCPVTDEEKKFNRDMNKLRECVEHAFGYLKMTFKHLTYYLVNRVLVSPVAVFFVVCVILINCKTCMRQYNPVNGYFGGPPVPQLTEYLHGQKFVCV